MTLLISAGMPAISCYSRAICGRGTGCFRKESVTCTARTTSDLNWCSTPNLQHLRAPGPALFWSNGNSGGAKVLLALADAHTLRGPSLKCSGVRTLDTPVSPRQLYTDHLTRPPSPQGQEIPTLLCRRLQRVRQKGSNVYQLNQWLWEFGRGKPRLGGLSVTVAETEARRIAVIQDGAKRGHATRVRRSLSHKAPKAAAAQ